jgi:prevent-host-death family protein
MDVGVRELKQRLSEYLDRAARGERITVTERGRPKALLVPLTGGDHLQRGLEEGWITPPVATGDLPPAPQRARANVTVAEMMTEDRGE